MKQAREGGSEKGRGVGREEGGKTPSAYFCKALLPPLLLLLLSLLTAPRRRVATSAKAKLTSSVMDWRRRWI